MKFSKQGDLSMLNIRHSYLIAVAVVIALPAAAVAQGLEEIVVTAQKREQSLQDVPISVTAFSNEDMTKLKMGTLLNLAPHTPGLMIKNQFGGEGFVFTIRGIGTNDPSTVNSPTISVYTDGVLIPYHMMLGFQLFDVERVEVLKGPQGTLYGRNNTGGAINFVTRKPEHDPSADFRIDYGTYETLEVEAAIGGGLTEDLAGRLAIHTRQRMKGFQLNSLFNQRSGEEDRLAGRALLNWTPTEDLDILVRLSGGRHDDDQWQYEHQGTQDPANVTFGPPAVLCGPALTGRRAEGQCVDFFGYFDPDDDPETGQWNQGWNDVLGDDKLESIFTTWGTGVTINWDLPRMTLTSTTGYEKFSRNATEDSDSSPLIALEAGFFDDIWAVSQEIRFSSDDSWKLMDRPIDWQAGLYYYVDNTHGSTVFLMSDLLATDVDHKFDQDVESIAGFGHFDWHFADQWTLNGGLRVTYEKREMTQTVVDLNPFGISVLNRFPEFLCFIGAIPQPCPPPAPGAIQTVDVQGREVSITEPSWEAGLQWRPSDDVMLYGKASYGFKSGGFNSLVVFIPGDAEPYDEETALAFEGGIKATLFDRSLRLNAAGFYMEWDSFQAQIPKAGSADFPVDNAGDAEIYGFEADVDWATPLEGLTLKFGLSYLDTEIVKTNPDLAFSMDGNVVGSAPEWSFNNVARYTHPLPWWGLNFTAQTDWYWQDKIFYDVKNTPPVQQSAYWIVNARFSLSPQDDSWEFAVWGKNLTETVYATELFDFTAVNGTALRDAGFPREVGVSLSYHWD